MVVYSNSSVNRQTLLLKHRFFVASGTKVKCSPVITAIWTDGNRLFAVRLRTRLSYRLPLQQQQLRISPVVSLGTEQHSVVLNEKSMFGGGFRM